MEPRQSLEWKCAMSSLGSHARKQASSVRKPASHPARGRLRSPRPEPARRATPVEGWTMLSTSVPHFLDSPWGVRLFIATIEKLALVLAAGLLGAGLALAAGALAGAAPTSILAALLRWLLTLFR
jgi:hypothetical protein